MLVAYTNLTKSVTQSNGLLPHTSQSKETQSTVSLTRLDDGRTETDLLFGGEVGDMLCRWCDRNIKLSGQRDLSTFFR